MKYLVIISMLMLSACTSKNKYGNCVGVNDTEDSKLVYKYSGWNIAMGIIFFEMIAPPVIVFLNETKCPVGVK